MYILVQIQYNTVNFVSMHNQYHWYNYRPHKSITVSKFVKYISDCQPSANPEAPLEGTGQPPFFFFFYNSISD